jgi:hypothetical protein
MRTCWLSPSALGKWPLNSPPLSVCQTKLRKETRSDPDAAGCEQRRPRWPQRCAPARRPRTASRCGFPGSTVRQRMPNGAVSVARTRGEPVDRLTAWPKSRLYVWPRKARKTAVGAASSRKTVRAQAFLFVNCSNSSGHRKSQSDTASRARTSAARGLIPDTPRNCDLYAESVELKNCPGTEVFVTC